MSDGINIVGTLTGAVGTVVAANMVVEALYRNGVPLAAYDLVSDRHGREGLVRAPIPVVEKIEDLPYRFTLFLDVMPAVWRVLCAHPKFFSSQRRAMIFYYELQAIPQDWRFMLSTFDVLFAPSNFVKDAISYSMHRESHLVPVVPFIDREPPPFAESGSPFRVLYSFDPLSAEDRKNPLAGINAFAHAFDGRDDAELLLRIWRTEKSLYAEHALADVQAMHPGIRIVQDDLSYEDNLAVNAASDCYLSLHRGEGLGLTILESMALHTSVIATNFGGATDFLDSDTGIPIPYILTEPATHHMLFTPEMLGEQGYWAEADVSVAAGALRWLAEDPARRAVLQRRARARYERRRAQFLSLNWLEPFLCAPASQYSFYALEAATT